MPDRGFVLRGQSEAIAVRAHKAGLGVEVVAAAAPPPPPPFARTLYVTAGANVPWDLLPAAWHFLEKWDAAVPLWRYGVTAAAVGTPFEQEWTEKVVGDLRVLLHATELVFARQQGAGGELLAAWAEEAAAGEDERLAFLRAVARVKPRLCVLPRSWLADTRRGPRRVGRRRRSPNAGQPLVQVEVAPGRYVKCHAGDEEKVLAHFARQQQRGG